MSDLYLNPKLYASDVEQEPIRAGFGRGLVAAGAADRNVVALCADLTDSTKMDGFKKAYPDRFFEIGIAEQNLVTTASGMSSFGLIPFVSSYAAFSPGRNWEQIRAGHPAFGAHSGWQLSAPGPRKVAPGDHRQNAI
jgi:transketolase